MADEIEWNGRPGPVLIHISSFSLTNSGTEKQDDDDLVFEDFARMRLKGDHTESADA